MEAAGEGGFVAFDGSKVIIGWVLVQRKHVTLNNYVIGWVSPKYCVAWLFDKLLIYI